MDQTTGCVNTHGKTDPNGMTPGVFSINRKSTWFRPCLFKLPDTSHSHQTCSYD